MPCAMESHSLPLHSFYILAFIYSLTVVLQVCHLADADIAPRFVQEPESQVVRKKSKVRFHCRAEPSNVEIRWKYNSEFLDSAELEDIDIRGSQLIIRSFRHERNEFTHTGTYQCIVNNSVGVIASKPVTLQAAYIRPFIENMESEAHAIRGHTAVIKCSPPESVPPAIVEYKRQREWVVNNSARMAIMPSGNLQIFNVSTNDKGTYKCSAVNPVSEKRQTTFNSTKLVVTEEDTLIEDMPVHIVYTSKRMTVWEGENATLECVAKGKPYPTISWLRQNGQMPVERVSDYMGNLIINNVQAADEGTYICIGQNGVGFADRKQVSLSVVVPPKIVRAPENVAAKIGERVEFQCQISGGNPITDIRWLFNAEPISDMSLKHSLLGEQLIVHEISEAQYGMYQCMVKNNQGVAMAAARLSLRVGYPEIIQPPEDKSVFEGDNVFIQCGVEGDPMPEVGWMKNFNTPILNSDRVFSIDDSSGGLTIFNAGKEDEGEYQCTAENSHGQVSSSAYLTVQALMSTTQTSHPTTAKSSTLPSQDVSTGFPLFGTVPDAPGKPEVEMTSDRSVMVRWTWNNADNGGSPITAFQVQYRNVLGQGGYITASSRVPPRRRSYEITGPLSNDNVYRFRVIAVNVHGEGKPSELSNRFVLSVEIPHQVRPPQHPPHISDTSCLTTAITVEWEYESSKDGVPINGFYMYHRQTDSDDDKDYIREIVLGVNTRVFTITNLDPETMYDVKMCSFNLGGAGAFSNVVQIETNLIVIQQTTQTTTIIAGGKQPESGAGGGGSGSSGKSSRSDSDMLYLIIGIVVALMVLMIVVFIAMCFWRSKRYVPPAVTTTDSMEWKKRQYYDPSSPVYMDINGSVSAGSQITACNGNTLHPTESLPYPTSPPPPPPPLTNGHVYCHDINAVNFNNPHEYKEMEPNLISSPNDLSYSSNTNRSDHSYSTVSERNRKNRDGFPQKGKSHSNRGQCCHGSSNEHLCSCDHVRSHSNSKSNKHRKHHKEHHFVRRPDCSCSSNYSGTESEHCLSEPPPPMMYSDQYLSDPPPIRYTETPSLPNPPPPPPPPAMMFTDIKPISKPRHSEL
ncbi:cell adhesion molecule-related/down-regulated by oncogenes-like isoform X2 [Glandiceps talaboti]